MPGSPYEASMDTVHKQVEQVLFSVLDPGRQGKKTDRTMGSSHCRALEVVRPLYVSIRLGKRLEVITKRAALALFLGETTVLTDIRLDTYSADRGNDR